MSTTLYCLLLAACLSGALAQTTTYFAPGIPTSRPYEGDYSGQYRPQVHYSPPKYFMNDPNGLHRDASGLWHLYYQYNPVESVPGDVHWGHATSPDLYHWENQKIALWPFNTTTQVFSGSAITDPNNTSGFFPGQDNGVVAFFTIYANGGLQTQNLAYSVDGGYSFTTYADNPILNVGSSQYRDPQVTWHAPTSKWVMAVSYASEYTIEFYTSSNLRNWTAVSNFTHGGLLGLAYECPNLVEVPVAGSEETMYILYISINRGPIRSDLETAGAPLGGSVGQYFPGTFNGTHFTAVDSATRIADFGKDNYASQFFYGVSANEPQVSIAWASNWQYTAVVPTGDTEGWRSQMSLPRNNYLKQLNQIGWVLVSEPYNIQSMFSQELAYNSSLGNSSILLDYSTVPSGALYFEANVTGLTSANLTSQGAVNFTFTSSVSGEYVSGGTFIGSSTTWLDRGHTYGFENPYFTDKFSATGIFGNDGQWMISGVIDRSIIEIFVNGGEQSATNTFYSTSPLDTLRIAANGIIEDAKVSVGIWALEDAWAMQANANGTVVGNITST